MIPILNAGHGGIVGGVYITPGKRSPKWSKGVLYEGMFNRWVMNRLKEKLDRANLPYFSAHGGEEDTPLKDRVKKANKYHDKNRGNVYYLSIHANAGGGEGIEVFTSRGQTKSDSIAEMFALELMDVTEAYGSRFRPGMIDGDLDKEAGFYELRKTKCPAVLLELGFMDHIRDYDRLWNEKYLESVVQALFNVIQKIYNSEL